MTMHSVRAKFSEQTYHLTVVVKFNARSRMALNNLAQPRAICTTPVFSPVLGAPNLSSAQSTINVLSLMSVAGLLYQADPLQLLYR